ncbi:MAG: hypothetical protein FJY73_02360 [Candidatus Eisenbacteria bacterium]|nr:hypothetical protein [Candidatus Eisenbacteria bacterium]
MDSEPIDEMGSLLEGRLRRYRTLRLLGRWDEAARELDAASRLASESLEEAVRRLFLVLARIDARGANEEDRGGRPRSGPQRNAAGKGRDRSIDFGLPGRTKN